jgi:hypothetical protein
VNGEVLEQRLGYDPLERPAVHERPYEERNPGHQDVECDAPDQAEAPVRYQTARPLDVMERVLAREREVDRIGRGSRVAHPLLPCHGHEREVGSGGAGHPELGGRARHVSLAWRRAPARHRRRRARCALAEPANRTKVPCSRRRRRASLTMRGMQGSVLTCSGAVHRRLGDAGRPGAAPLGNRGPLAPGLGLPWPEAGCLCAMRHGTMSVSRRAPAAMLCRDRCLPRHADGGGATGRARFSVGNPRSGSRDNSKGAWRCGED